MKGTLGPVISSFAALSHGFNLQLLEPENWAMSDSS